jgi:hypothetical protein
VSVSWSKEKGMGLCGLVEHEPIALEITRGRERSLEFSVRKKESNHMKLLLSPASLTNTSIRGASSVLMELPWGFLHNPPKRCTRLQPGISARCRHYTKKIRKWRGLRKSLFWIGSQSQLADRSASPIASYILQ